MYVYVTSCLLYLGLIADAVLMYHKQKSVLTVSYFLSLKGYKQC